MYDIDFLRAAGHSGRTATAARQTPMKEDAVWPDSDAGEYRKDDTLHEFLRLPTAIVIVVVPAVQMVEGGGKC